MTDKYFELNNKVLIPSIGFGTWQIRNGEETYNACLTALKTGYFHIDTANAYQNEESVGRAIKDSGLKRQDIFVTSKLNASKKGYEITMVEFEKTLKELDLDYLDLYLIHAPRPWSDKSDRDYTKENIESYKAMETLYKQGKIRAIGVSNFTKKDLEAIIENCEIVPQVNQIRFHIGCLQQETVDFCKEHNILVEAYSPFATGRLFNSEELKGFCNKYQLDPAKVCMRWCLKHDTLPLPKSVNNDRIISNFNVDIDLTDEQMKELDRINL